MKVDTEQLMGATDIALMLGVVPSAVSNWIKRSVDFPKPVAHVSNDRIAIWLRDDVLRWYAHRSGTADKQQLIERHRAILAALGEE